MAVSVLHRSTVAPVIRDWPVPEWTVQHWFTAPVNKRCIFNLRNRTLFPWRRTYHIMSPHKVSLADGQRCKQVTVLQA